MKFRLLLFLIVVLPFQIHAQNQYYKIQSQSASGLTIVFDFQDIEIAKVSDESSPIRSIQIPSLTLNYDNDKPSLPVLSLPLVLPEGKISVNMTVENSTPIDGIYPPVFDNAPTSDRAETKELRAFTGVYPERIYEIKDLGLFRDYHISTLRIYPVQVTSGGVVFYKKFTLTISFPNTQPPTFNPHPSEMELLRKVVVNQSQANLVAPVEANYQPPAYSPQVVGPDSRVKLIVRSDGIYKVTGSDLQNANVDISQIIPSSFRLTNKGDEVAVYIYGDGDNSFDPEDYIEFWGEGNRKTFVKQYPDLYQDPFSDENVYWLEWGGNAGLRMVEENGSLITNDPTKYNRSPYYQTTVHVEQNTNFQRLGDTNLDQLSYMRDYWFYGGEIKAVGRRQYQFNLIYPDSTNSNINPVFVDAMLSGRSQGGHQVFAWVNDNVIGTSDPNWIGQDTSRITNRPNSTMKSYNLAHGPNLFEIQLPTPVISGTDIVLLNWFEVTYDRQYRAYQNYIEFKRPSYIARPNIDLFQFDIEGFRRLDIEIYKKDISKIVNFDVRLETINNTNIYNVSFQDHVLSDDVEYVALTGDKKKKPARIELDRPFDPENPQRVLKDPSNSADYLIITHSRFYDNALELRDYRRSQGLDVELVNVEDIYDEFNYGIKSPLAIKSFLKYAYRNWNQNHKLKYVLLFGDANYDYKSTSTVNADLVPTFFYQSIEFGAVATDFPYGLVSGNDLLPDLFVGRIPAATNSEVIIAIEKIIEYEQNAPIGQWRNQALFISGNDKETFDQLDGNRPLFRTQNSRVVENQIPDYVSSFRLNAVPDTSLHPDPNFGTSTDLIEYFDDGLFMINFLGHGGGRVWADVNLMRLSDVDRLNNKGRYPFVTSMTCFTGAFDNPGQIGLAQKLVLAPDKGAIGVIGSSGLGWAYNDFAMLWAVDQNLLDESLTVGEGIALGKIYYLSSRSGYYVNDRLLPTPQHPSGNYLGDDMVHQYNLVGDPYIRMARTPDDLDLSLNNNNPQPGDTLEVIIQSPVFPAEGYIEITDNEDNIVNRLPIFITNASTTVLLQVPGNYPEGTGVVRAYLSNENQDASGFERIGINYAVIDSVVIEPPAPDADDSVYVSLKVSDAQGIQRVYLLKQNNFSDTLYAQEVAPGVYRTIHPFPPIYKVGNVYYSIYVENLLGNKSVFRNHKYKIVDERPDVFIYSNSFRFTGKEKAQLQVNLGNQGGSIAQGTPVYFYDGYDNFNNQTPFASGTADVNPGDSVAVKVDFPLNLSQPDFRVYASVDPFNQISDFNRDNNVDSSLVSSTIFNVTPELGSTYSNVSSDTISTNPAYQVFFPPGSVDRPTAVKIGLKQFEPPTDQPGLTPISIVTPSEYHGVEVRVLNPEAQLITPFYLQIDLGSISSLENVKLYEKPSGSQPWLFTDASIDSIGKKMVANSTKSSVYAPFISGDENAPRIELTVNGRPIQNRAVITSKPVMYIVVEDESGLNFSRDNIRVLMDNAALPEDKVFIPDSTKRNSILGITVYPELTAGEHRFSVQLSDVNGNSSLKEWQLVVNDQFDVHIFGNYPNPFTDFTVFSYFVTGDVLDEFEIRIYTVSGRLIKRITEDENTIHDTRGFGAKNLGYNELMWDGTDRNGVKVANGVYFAFIRAKLGDETREEILKVAKLK